jgi:hypothetical protein
MRELFILHIFLKRPERGTLIASPCPLSRQSDSTLKDYRVLEVSCKRVSVSEIHIVTVECLHGILSAMLALPMLGQEESL